MNDPPISDAELERMRLEHPRCEECHREPWQGHFPWCSKAEPGVRKRYSEYEQKVHYRIAARELGCICPATLGPHTHVEGCPLYETPAEVSDRLDEEHVGDAYLKTLEQEVADDERG